MLNYSSVDGQQVSSDGEEAGPYSGVESPFQSVGLVHLLPPLPVEANYKAFHVANRAMLGAQVAVAAQRDVVAVDGNDAVQHVVLRSNLSQHGIAHAGRYGFDHQCLVAIVFKKRTHRKAAQSQGDRVAFVHQLHNLGQELGIGKLNLFYLDMVLWHTMAASLSGLQCMVKMGVVSTTRVTVSQMS